jgi:Holliday junction resolvase RusA-like endonuclease
MTHLILPIKALTINQMFCGDHIKTSLCRKYDKELNNFLKSHKEEITRCDWYECNFRLYLKTFLTADVDNCINKSLIDALVRNGYISDDRRIKRFVGEKFPSDYDRIEVDIFPYLGIV